MILQTIWWRVVGGYLIDNSNENVIATLLLLKYLIKIEFGLTETSLGYDQHANKPKYERFICYQRDIVNELSHLTKEGATSRRTNQMRQSPWRLLGLDIGSKFYESFVCIIIACDHSQSIMQKIEINNDKRINMKYYTNMTSLWGFHYE